MFFQGSVTGLTIYLRMFAGVLLFHHVAVAGLATLVSGKV